MAQITTIAATTATELNKSPYLVGNPVHLECVAGGTIYGVNLAGRDARGGKYQRWLADGVNVQWNKNTVVNLANADTSTPSAADMLRVIVKKNGSLLQRVAAATVPTTGQFSVTNGARGVAKVVFGAVPADAVTVTLKDASNTVVFEFDTGNNGVTSGRTEVDTSAAVTAEDAAAAFVAAVNGVTTGLLVTARDIGDGVVMLYQDAIGATGNTVIAVSSATAITAPAAFAGGIAAGTPSIQFGDIHPADTQLEIFLAASADIDTEAVVANVSEQWAAYQVVYATAAMQAIRLTR